MNIKIGIAYHKESPILSNNIYLPIHVGKDLNPSIDLHIQPDNEGDSISFENGYYCELTATYWIWKNIRADYKGICHYRRVFSCNYSIFDKIKACISYIRCKIYLPQKKYSNVNDYIRDSLEASKRFENILTQYPIIAPQKIITTHTTYNHFVVIGRDYIDILKDIILTKYSYAYKFLLMSLNSHSFYYANMIIMRDDYFNEYCEFLFGVLNEVKDKMLNEHWITSTDELIFSRKLGYLAEILTSTFLIIKEYESVPIKRMAISILR